MPIDLIIFDCDGVLVDSEIISCRVHSEVLTGIGYPITADEVFNRFLGRSNAEANREIEAELGRKLPDDFALQLKARELAELAETVEGVPHVATALDAIRQNICVASSGTPEKIRTGLTRANLYDRFAPHIFSASQVKRGKPEPDLFLFAAAQMKTPPSRCIVIEDSIPGIIGATAAGMTVLGFRGGAHYLEKPERAPSPAALEGAGAVRVFDDMRQLPAIIAEISS
ncbi:MAG: HAD family hydrolase [Pseudomonadota bacterium]